MKTSDRSGNAQQQQNRAIRPVQDEGPLARLEGEAQEESASHKAAED
jgi:hypothetical protein